jgi:uncharacterized protein YeaO (DUF488 family)
VAISIVRLGSAKSGSEGIRIGTVRRPPRGVPKAEIARRGYYDVWFPILSPSPALVARAKTATQAADWRRFVEQFKREMSAPEPNRALDLLAALSSSADFSVGCYCEDERHCHRSVLRELLAERGARII